MEGLHRSDDTEPAEPGNILAPQVLRVLDPEPPVPGAVGLGDAVVDREQHPVGFVSDRVDGDLEPRRIGLADPPGHAVRWILEESAIPGRVGVGLIEPRGARARGTVHEAFHPADPDPVVARPTCLDGVGYRTPVLQRVIEYHSHGEAAGLLHAPEAGERGEGRGHR